MANGDGEGYPNPGGNLNIWQTPGNPNSSNSAPGGGSGLPGNWQQQTGLTGGDGGAGGGPGTGFPNNPFTPAAPAAPNGAGISPDDLILDPQTGELYGFKRTIESGTGNKTIYGYETVDLGSTNDATGLAAIATATGMPAGVISTKISQLQVQNAQTKAQGYGKLISANPDGTYTYQDATGTRQTTANPADLAKVGLSVGEIQQAIAQSGETQRTMTQMGQYTVAGMDQNGNLQVRDFDGALHTVTAAMAASGQIPGVSYADFQRAQSDYASNQRTLTQAGQYTVQQASIDQDGNLTYYVKNFNGQVTPIYGPQLEAQVQAGQVPGVTMSDLQQAQYHAQDMAWQLSPVNAPSTQGPQYGSGAQPTQPTPSVPSPNPTPSYPSPVGSPGAAPNPTPNYPGPTSSIGTPPWPPTPGASPTYPAPGGSPGVSPNPSPTPSGYAGYGGTPSPSPSASAYSSYSNSPSNSDSSGAITTGSTMTNQSDRSGAVSPSPLSAGQQASYAAYSATPNPTPTPSNYASTPTTASGTSLGTAMTYAATSNSPTAGMTHQEQGQQNLGYQQNQQMTQAQNAGQSRNVSGLGFSGIQQARVAGY